MPAGQHLLQVTGILTCPSGNQEIFDLILEYGTEKPVVLQMKSNCMSSYGYPYCFSHLIDINEDRQLVIYGQMKNIAVTTTLANHMTTLMPIVKLN